MARQPFLPTFQHCNYTFGDDTLTRRPELSGLISRVAFLWSNVEVHLALIMGAILGVENAASVAVFTALRNNRARREAMKAASDAALRDELREIFDAILNIHRSLDGQRNDIVHGVWGYSNEITDGVLWHSVQSYATALVRDYHSIRPSRVDPTFDRVANIRRELFVYRFADLDAVADDIRTFMYVCLNFHCHLRYGSHGGEESLRLLNDEPLLQREIQKMRNSGGKTPPVPSE